MSVMVMNVRSEEKLINSFPVIKKATYERIEFFAWYKLVGAAAMLNIKSWNERYPEHIITDQEIKTKYMINAKNTEKFNNDCEILKALQFLIYNIDLDNMTVKEKKILNDIEAIENHMKTYIITNLDDYKKANWG